MKKDKKGHAEPTDPYTEWPQHTHKYTDGHTHEALHTAHVLCDTWDRHVIDTHCCDEFPDVKKAAKKAADAMYNVYQLIGQKFGQKLK